MFGAAQRSVAVRCANYTRDHSADDDDDSFYDDDDGQVVASSLWDWIFWSSVFVLLLCPLGFYWTVPVSDYAVYRTSRRMEPLDEESPEGATMKSGRE